MTSHRINHQPAFLLTSKPWRENSLWLEIFSRDYGRVALLARSARTRGSELRGVLVPFVPIDVSWFGKEELKTLHRAEWIGGWMQPKNRLLFSALYVNELLLKLTAREDPHPKIYDAMSELMRQIAEQHNHVASLRHFEWLILRELGYAPDAQRDERGTPIIADAYYILRPEHAAQKCASDNIPTVLPPDACVIQGEVLQQLDAGCLHPQHLTAALSLNRQLIQHQLPDGIASRQVLQQLTQLKQRFF